VDAVISRATQLSPSWVDSKAITGWSGLDFSGLFLFAATRPSQGCSGQRSSTVNAPSSSSLGATALREPWPPVLFASTGLYPELSFSILQSPSRVGPLERHLAIYLWSTPFPPGVNFLILLGILLSSILSTWPLAFTNLTISSSLIILPISSLFLVLHSLPVSLGRKFFWQFSSQIFVLFFIQLFIIHRHL
jgi:hypothetical protein